MKRFMLFIRLIKKIFYLLLIVFFGDVTIAYSQLSRCGTQASVAQLNFENTFTVPQASASGNLPQLNRTLTIAVFVVNNSKNQPDITTVQINAAISALNQYFNPIALNFKIDNISYIEDFQFDTIVMGGNELQLTTSYFEYNVINLYLVSGLYDVTQTNVCGYTYMPPSKSGSVFIEKSCLSGSSLVHQIGHFFDLFHTHETILGAELVARPGNCSSAGDRCCDTEADPNLEGLVNGNCAYTGTAKDANNAFYYPSTKNIMSFSNDNCRCNFSNTQFLRMIYTLNNVRSYLR